MNGGRLAVIPARGGSKRIPRKNILPFAGVPMIGHAIRAARASGLFDHVIVSTDDAQIADVARREGAEVPFMRPAALADDHTATVPVIGHAILACQALGWAVDSVCCLYPAVPLLPPQALAQGLELLDVGECDYVFPVLAFGSPIQRALQRTNDGRTSPFFPEHAQTRTQDLAPAYHDAGQFYWGRAPAWLAGLSLHAHARTLVLPEGSVIDIDTPADWARAEAAFAARPER
ncbi:MAG: pseudaminic acid cytidylyltransferase [Burkholderiaceae bacterium]